MFPYAQEINKLIELAKEADPEVDARLWPAPIPMQDVDGVAVQVFGTYESVMTAARRIVANLPRGIAMAVV